MRRASAAWAVFGLAGCVASTRSEPAGLDTGRVAGPRGVEVKRALERQVPFQGTSTVVGRSFSVPGWGGPDDLDAGELALVPELSVFLQELGTGGHSNSQLEGETLLGFLAPARMRFRAGDEVQIEGGVLAGRHYGDDESLDVTEPIARLVWEPWESSMVIAGSLYVTHPMHEALLDDEERLRDPVSEGLQFRRDGDGWQQDFWLDWKVREAPDRREQFDVGNVSRVRAGPVWLEGEMLWSHAGGQKNTVEDKLDNVILKVGGVMPIELVEGRTDLTPRLAWFYAQSEEGERDECGRGLEGRLELRHLFSPRTGLETFVSHFRGDDLFTSRGDPLYQLDSYSHLGARLYHLTEAGMQVDAECRITRAEGEFDYRFALFFSWSGLYSVWKSALRGLDGSL